MPEYLAPGVFVEETSFRAKSIEGVGTSVAAIVGPTRFGPLRGKPEVVTSYDEFRRIFGDAHDLALSGGTQTNHTAIAVRAFFDNGGKQLFVSRVMGGVNDGTAFTAGTAVQAFRSVGTVVTLKSRFAGAYGNLWLELKWRDSENVLSTEVVTDPATDAVLLTATGVTKAAFSGVIALADNKFPVSITAVVKQASELINAIQTTVLNVQDGRAVVKDKDGVAVALADVTGKLISSALPAGTRLTKVTLKKPSSGLIDAQTLVQLTSNASSLGTITAITGDLESFKSLTGTFDPLTASLTFTKAINPALPGNSTTIPLAALAAIPGNAASIAAIRTFDLDVLSKKDDGTPSEVMYSYAGLSTAISGPTSLKDALPAAPAKKSDWLASPLSATLGAGATDGAAIYGALSSLFETAYLNPKPNTAETVRYLIKLTSGADGDTPAAIDYAGEIDAAGSTGLASFEDLEDISIVMTPFAATYAANAHQAVVSEVEKHCVKMRYRVGIVDARKGMSVGEVRDWRSQFDNSRLALYYPWVVASNPNGPGEVVTPPAGFIAGVYAYTDVDRGVHKAPANEIALGALRFDTEVNRFQQELLNPNGINCLRSFPGRGHRVWGGRTLSGDPEWKYVNVRRYFLYLERSIEKSTQWIVFEPNGEALWDNVRQTVDSFLFNEWKNGRLLGSSPKEAYFVRCDRSTMTQNDLDNGRLVCLIGVAPLKPAEFVIFRIGQKTADA